MYYKVEISRWENGEGGSYWEVIADGETDELFTALEFCLALEVPLITKEEVIDCCDIRVEVTFYVSFDAYWKNKGAVGKSACWASEALIEDDET